VISLREKDDWKLWNRMMYCIPIILLAVNIATFGYYKRLSIARQPDYPYRATCTYNGINHLRVISYSRGCEIVLGIQASMAYEQNLENLRRNHFAPISNGVYPD
jgi:hypothetical protein